MTMASDNYPPAGSSLGSGIAALRSRWGWIVAIGVLLAICGVIALGSVMLATAVSVTIVGFMMVLSGAAEMAHGFASKSWGRFFLWVLLGALYALAGVFAILNPFLAATVLTLLLGAGLIASGIVRILLAFQMREGTPWVWVALSGLITLLLGGMILSHWPASSLFVLGLFLGIDLIFAGTSWIAMGLALRRA